MPYQAFRKPKIMASRLTQTHTPISPRGWRKKKENILKQSLNIKIKASSSCGSIELIFSMGRTNIKYQSGSVLGSTGALRCLAQVFYLN
jgi:hypothetical protein